MIEQGLDYEVPYWTAIYAPAATPKPIVDKLSAEIAKAMKDRRVIGQLKNAGTEAVGSTPPRWTLQPRAVRALSQDRAEPET